MSDETQELGATEKGPETQSALFRVYDYDSYAHYIQHQRAKTPNLDPGTLQTHSEGIYGAIKARLADAGCARSGMRILCLGARLGGEVRAFMEAGSFAVGVDIYPGPDNPYVVYGDFQALQFPDGCADLVYTNSFDHVYDPSRAISEINRVLIPHGLVWLDAIGGTDAGTQPGAYESYYWKSFADLLTAFEKGGLILARYLSHPQPAWRSALLEKQRAVDG